MHRQGQGKARADMQTTNKRVRARYLYRPTDDVMSVGRANQELPEQLWLHSTGQTGR